MTGPGGSEPGQAAGLTIRPVTAEDDLATGIDLWHRAFGAPGAGTRERWQATLAASRDSGRLLGAWNGPDCAGVALYEDMRQWWHGRDLPMAGVAGVAVAPEARGRGAGRALMTGLLRLMAGRGYPLSVLYPATNRLYRSLGWEVAGGRYLAEIPARSLASLLPADPVAAATAAIPAKGWSAAPRAVVRRARPEDARLVTAVLGAIYQAQLDAGPVTRDRESVVRLLSSESDFSYLAPDGFLSYTWDTGRGILVHALRAGSPGTLRELWAIVANHATIAETVRVALGPADPVTWLTAEPDVQIRNYKNWMLRILDPARAIAGRGFPPGVRADVTLLLEDPDLPAGSGRYRLRVDEGLGTLEGGKLAPGGAPTAPLATRLGPRGFAAMYGGVPLATLRQAGLVTGGGPADDARLDSAFGATAYLLDLF